MNQEITNIKLRDFMDEPEGWGRADGRKVYQRLFDFVEAHPKVVVFRVSMQGVRRVDMSFASETLVELARRYRATKGFCILDLQDADVIDNWDAAAESASRWCCGRAMAPKSSAHSPAEARVKLCSSRWSAHRFALRSLLKPRRIYRLPMPAPNSSCFGSRVLCCGKRTLPIAGV
jgi:hypothetical protein